MRNYLGPILIFVSLAFALWLGSELGTTKRDESELRLRTLCDSLQHANREHELHIMQLEKEIEDCLRREDERSHITPIACQKDQK